MKKIIALFVIMLAFSLNANAQQKKTTTAPAAAKTQAAPNEDAIQKAAMRDFELMSSTIAMTEEQKQIYKGLFTSKHRTLISNPELSQERKDVLARNYEAKIKSALNPDQIAKLDSNPELLKTLTH